MGPVATQKHMIIGYTPHEFVAATSCMQVYFGQCVLGQLCCANAHCIPRQTNDPLDKEFRRLFLKSGQCFTKARLRLLFGG